MRVVCVVLMGLAAVAPAGAQPAPSLTLHEAVAEATANNPEIAAARLGYDAAKLRPLQDRSLPDPMVSAGYSSIGRPWPGAGIGREPTANIGVMVSQAVPYPGKRQLRGDIASRVAEAEGRSVDVVTLDVTGRVKQAYYRLAYTYEVEDVLTRNRDLLHTLLAVSESRYSVGSAAQQDVIKAQTQLSILELQLERVRQERWTREGELKALMGRGYDAVLGRPDVLEATPFTLSLDEILAAAQAHSPALQRDKLLVERSNLSVEAARREYKPDFGISGGYYFQGSMPPMYEFRVDVQLPLQRAKRAAAVAEQQASANAASRTYEADRLSLQGRLTEEYQATATSARLALLYRETVLPQARLALESSLASYRTGGVDFLSVLTNFGTVLEYEMTYYDELTAYHVAVSRLEAMAGTAVAHEAHHENPEAPGAAAVARRDLCRRLRHARHPSVGRLTRRGPATGPVLRRPHASAIQVRHARDRTRLRHDAGAGICR
ncbi:MAG: TolC family protein [Acidobacteria bacterium]|nr:TolC family protein [Acidobacteriota bacterium]